MSGATGSTDWARKKRKAGTPPGGCWDNVQAQMDMGINLLKASPSSSDARSVRYQNPLILVCNDGILPGLNKMVPPPPRASLLKAFGHAVAEGQKHWATVSSCLGEGMRKELNQRPMAAVAGVFLCIPPENYRMGASDRVDVLVYKDGEVVKKALSPRFGHEVGSEPAPRKNRGMEKSPIVRFKTDIVIQGKNERGVWEDRLSIEHKGSQQHHDDRWEALSRACRTMLKGIADGSLVPRHYVYLWGEEKLLYQILDVFGVVEVENGGNITDDAYQQFLRHYNKVKCYMGPDNFPSDSVQRWVSRVDSLPGATPLDWQKEEHASDPFTKSRLLFYFQYQQQSLLLAYNCVIPKGKYLVGVSYCPRKPEAARVFTRRSSFEEAVELTLSMVRIVLGDRVLNWGYDEVEEVIGARLQVILETVEKKVDRNLNDKINIFELQSMGTINRMQANRIGGGWSVKETEEQWIIQMYWDWWNSTGQRVNLVSRGGRTWIEITEGELPRGFSRTVQINLPPGIVTARLATHEYYDMTIACSKGSIKQSCVAII